MSLKKLGYTCLKVGRSSRKLKGNSDIKILTDSRNHHNIRTLLE
jgi:hypothetical protein